MSITFPDVSLNGTAASDLLTGYLLAKKAISRAIEALHDSAPHSRDYIPQGSPDALARYRQAAAEHSDRVLKLRTIAAELETLAEHVV